MTRDANTAVGEGTFPFERLFAFIQERGLRPILTVEAHTEQNLSKALENIRNRGYLEGLGATGRPPLQTSAAGRD